MGEADQELQGMSAQLLPLGEVPNQKHTLAGLHKYTSIPPSPVGLLPPPPPTLTPPLPTVAVITLGLLFLDFSVIYHSGLPLVSVSFIILALLGAQGRSTYLLLGSAPMTSPWL